MKGAIKDINFELGGGIIVTLSLPRSELEAVYRLEESPVDVTIKKYREKRSLSANAYAWVLITKIAQCTRPPMSKENVYKEMLKSYGQVGVISVLTTKAEPVKRELKYWESAGTGTVDGKEFEHIRFWVGSSLYDKHEMALFIDGIASEAKDLGIETLTPQELERMKGEWT